MHVDTASPRLKAEFGALEWIYHGEGVTYYACDRKDESLLIIDEWMMNELGLVAIDEPTHTVKSFPARSDRDDYLFHASLVSPAPLHMRFEFMTFPNGGTVLLQWEKERLTYDSQGREPEVRAEVNPSPESWRRLWRVLRDAGAESWGDHTAPDIDDGAGWQLALGWDEMTVKANGNNAVPPPGVGAFAADFAAVVAELTGLAGGLAVIRQDCIESWDVEISEAVGNRSSG